VSEKNWYFALCLIEGGEYMLKKKTLMAKGAAMRSKSPVRTPAKPNNATARKRK